MPKVLGKDLFIHISKQKNKIKKQQSVTAWLLLSEVFDFKNQNILEVKYTKNGKPYITNMPFFSISHSEEYVAVAICDKKIGCDIQFHKEINYMQIANRCFNELELNFINKSHNKVSAFYEIWVKKESFVKMTGEGFDKNFNSFNIFDYNYYFNNSIVNDYSVAVCTENNSFLKKLKIFIS